MIKIRLTESELQKIITEGVRAILTESQESKSISAAKKLVLSRGFRNTESEADEFVRVTLRGTFTALRTPQGGKFILGVTRMYLDGEIYNANIIASLNETLKLIASDAHINEYDRNLNGESAESLIERFSGAIMDNAEASRNSMNGKVFEGGSEYKIVRIDSFDQARQYGQYTDWCVTHYQNMFDNYTCNGVNQFYFCLRNGFENEQRRAGDGCPLDSYGLSMIAVLVNDKGNLVHCTCRWNHDKGGNDNIMDDKEVSDVINMNFYSVFKPNNSFNEAVEDAMAKIKAGYPIDDVFDYNYPADDEGWYHVVELNGMSNYIILESMKLLCKDWFNVASPFTDGAAAVKRSGKWNYIRQDDGSYLSEQWFDYCEGFDDGIARVFNKTNCNLISFNGDLLCDEWYSKILDFRNNFAIVVRKDENWDFYNYIDKKGRRLSDIWFSNANNFIGGFAIVTLGNGKHSMIDSNGRLLSKEGFNEIFNMRDGLARVMNDNRYNFINTDGDLISDQWFRNAEDFEEGVARVVNSSFKTNLISRDGELLCDEWFNHIKPFHEGYAVVSKKTTKSTTGYVQNLVGKNGQLLFGQWFELCYGFEHGFCVVYSNGKFNFIDKNGNILCNEWLDYANSFSDRGYAAVMYHGKEYKLNINGELKEW